MLLYIFANCQNITTSEYFFDTDPGIGNGTAISITPGNTIEFNETIPTTNLNTGFHKLYVRFKNENNQWSLYEARSFFIQDFASYQIIEAEYFFDTDPGIGNGTAISITSGNTIEFNETIPTTNLNTGFHKLYVRFKNENNQWSLYEARSFFIQDFASYQIIEAEYFFDTDPGIGNGTAISITSGNPIEFNETIPTTNLNTGFHKLYVRFKNENNQWSLYEVQDFEIRTQYTIFATINPINSGTITGNGNYFEGENIQLIASPATGYTFTNWTEDGTEVSTNSNYSFTVTENRTLVANFVLQTFDISASVSPANSGTITGTRTFDYGETANLTATAETGYDFVNWTENGTEVSTNPNYSFTVTENRAFVAVFQITNDISDFSKINSITIYPNPNTGLFSLVFENSYKGELIIKIYSGNGSVIKELKTTKSLDKFLYSIDLENINIGLYYIDIISSKEKITKTIIIY